VFSSEYTSKNILLYQISNFSLYFFHKINKYITLYRRFEFLIGYEYKFDLESSIPIPVDANSVEHMIFDRSNAGIACSNLIRHISNDL
jgi:hypothetical protein